MKKITLILSLIMGVSLNAQNYTFTNLTGTYADLTGTTSLSNGEIWDDPEYTLALPFTFSANGASTNTFVVADGGLYFTNGMAAQGLFVLFADLEDRGSDGTTSLSPISFKTDGVVGSRIVKIEFKNCGAWSDFDKTMFINFQMWLYEGSNIIEYRYGASSITNTSIFYDEETGPMVGVAGGDGGDEFINSHLLTGSANSPTLSTVNDYIFLDGTPSANRIFRFTPTNLNTVNVNAFNVSLYPNPFTDSIVIQGLDETFSYAIYDLQGKMIQSNDSHSGSNSISTASIASGVYLIKISSNGASVTKKIVKM